MFIHRQNNQHPLIEYIKHWESFNAIARRATTVFLFQLLAATIITYYHYFFGGGHIFIGSS